MAKRKNREEEDKVKITSKQEEKELTESMVNETNTENNTEDKNATSDSIAEQSSVTGETPEVSGDAETSSHKSEETRDEKDELMEKLEKIKSEKDELYDKYLRLYSEFENFRRRTIKEKSEIIERAGENIITELLPVIDDFERALQSMKEASDVKSVVEGVELIFSKLMKVMENQGLKEIDCIEKDFDPELHEAITKIPAPKKKLKGKVVDQIQKGYYLKDHVIRHSKVVVGE